MLCVDVDICVCLLCSPDSLTHATGNHFFFFTLRVYSPPLSHELGANRFDVRYGVMFRLVVFLAFVLYAFAELSFDGADQSIVLLAEYGSAETYVSVLYKGPLAQPVVTRRKGSQVFTTGDVQTTVVGDVTNFTIPFMIVNVVGVIRYNITVGNDVVMGNITAAGFILTNSTGHVVSGEEGNGAFINLSGNPTKLDVKAVNTDGKSVDISSTTINPRPEMGVYMKELNTKLTTINSEQLVLVGNFLRLGTGLFFVEFETPTITLNDESFVTLLKVKQRVRNVSCVAYAGKYQVKNGFVRIAMYNVGMPPRNFSLSDISITVGSTTVSWDTSKSLLDPPDQTIFFRITEEGSAHYYLRWRACCYCPSRRWFCQRHH